MSKQIKKKNTLSGLAKRKDVIFLFELPLLFSAAVLGYSIVNNTATDDASSTSQSPAEVKGITEKEDTTDPRDIFDTEFEASGQVQETVIVDNEAQDEPTENDTKTQIEGSETSTDDASNQPANDDSKNSSNATSVEVGLTIEE